MSATMPETSPRSDTGRKILRLTGVVAVFALLGPLVGGLVTITGFGIWVAFPSPGDIVMAMLAMMIYGLWIAYPMGFIPAALAGVVIGFMDAFRGGASLAFATALGIAMGAGWGMMMGGGSDKEQIVLHILIGLASIIATLVCWLLTRRLIRG